MAELRIRRQSGAKPPLHAPQRRPYPRSEIANSKIKRGIPLYEQIYDALWELIFNGKISPGERLSDRDWAQRLDTSRTPVREAMRQMARDGVLLAMEYGGYQVRPVDPQGLADLYKCRAPLVALAVHDTTLAGNDRMFEQISAVVANTRKAIAARDAAATLKFNSKFYRLIVGSCGNAYLEIVMANLEKLILFYRIALLKTSTVKHEKGYFEHLARANERQRKISDLMAQRDAKQAKLLTEQHLMASAEDMIKLLRDT